MVRSRICTRSSFDDVTARRSPSGDTESADGRLPPMTSSPLSERPMRVLTVDDGVAALTLYVHTEEDASVLKPPIVRGGSASGDLCPAGFILSANWL